MYYVSLTLNVLMFVISNLALTPSLVSSTNTISFVNNIHQSISSLIGGVISFFTAAKRIRLNREIFCYLSTCSDNCNNIIKHIRWILRHSRIFSTRLSLGMLCSYKVLCTTVMKSKELLPKYVIEDFVLGNYKLPPKPMPRSYLLIKVAATKKTPNTCLKPVQSA